MPPTNKPQARRLKCNDPCVVQRFNQYYFEFLRKHKLHKRVFALEAIICYPLPIRLQREAEKLDVKKMEGILWADKRCRKLRMGGIPFSWRFQEPNSAVGFWNEMLRETLGNEVNSKTLQRLIKKAAIPTLLREIRAYTLEQVETKRNKNYKAYTKFLGQANAARATWLEELAEARAAEVLKQRPQSKRKRHASRRKCQASSFDDDTTEDPLKKATADQLRQLRDIERIRSSARRVKAALGVNCPAGITMVEAPNEDGVVEQQTDPDGIVKGCMWENKRRFRQTQHTPFMTDPLCTRVGYLGIGRGAEEILNGTFDCPAEVSPQDVCLIQGLRRINGTAETPIHTGMPTSEYRQGWKEAREKTSARPSTLTFGHCKAGALDPRIVEFEAAMATASTFRNSNHCPL
jgi:hypothetical protein